MDTTIQQQRGDGKGVQQPLGATGSDAPGPRRGQGEAKDWADADPMSDRPMPVSLLLACARVKSPDGWDHPAIHRPRSEGRPDRRVTPRHSGVLLSQVERARVREMTVRALGCRSQVVSLRRSVAGQGSVAEQRLVMAVPCGTRMCEPCDAERRKREAGRVQGHWRLFWTVGIPSGSHAAAASWREMGRWTTALFRELRRELASGAGENVRLEDEDRERVRVMNEALPEGKRKAAALQYAWCLEPHLSGWPHLHFVTNASFIRHSWFKALWGRIVGAQIRWAKYKTVKDQDGVCRYLSKYISKTTFSPDITSIMYRRRQWASTVPKPEVKRSGWTLEDETEGRDLFLETVEPDAVARSQGWTVKLGKVGEYAMYERVFSESEWIKYEQDRYKANRFDRLTVRLEDPEYDAHIQRARLRMASVLDRARAREMAGMGIEAGDRRAEWERLEAIAGGALRGRT